MIDDILAVLVYLLVPFAWLSTGVLAYAASGKPRVGALVERTWIAFVIAIFLTTVAVIVFNTESDQALIQIEIARIIFRVSVLLLGLVPVAWVILWLTGRLGK